MLLKSLTVKPLLYVIAALVAALGGTAVGWALDHYAKSAELAEVRGKLGTEQTSRQAADNKVEELAATNASQALVVTGLVEKLDTAIKETERLDGLLYDANAGLAVAARDRADALDRLNNEREKVYAVEDGCSAWGAAAVCAGITRSVRNQWAEARAGR